MRKKDRYSKLKMRIFRLRAARTGSKFEPLYCLCISAKRYALFNVGKSGEIIIRKASAHGLGQYLAPYEAEDAPGSIPPPSVPLDEIGVDRWQYDLWHRSSAPRWRASRPSRSLVSRGSQPRRREPLWSDDAGAIEVVQDIQSRPRIRRSGEAVQLPERVSGAPAIGSDGRRDKRTPSAVGPESRLPSGRSHHSTKHRQGGRDPPSIVRPESGSKRAR